MKELFNLQLEESSIIFNKVQSNESLDLNTIIRLLQEHKALAKKVIVYNGNIYNIQEVLSLIQETAQFATAGIEEAIRQVEAQMISIKKDDFVSKDNSSDNATILKQLINNGIISDVVKIPNTTEIADTTENKALIPDKTNITGIFSKTISENDSIFEKIQIINSLGKKLDFINGSIQGSYGQLEISNTKWSYTLDDSIQKLNEGDSVIDSFKITLEDGTSKNITITINGVNDAPTIENTNISLIEDGNTSGQIAYFDIDSATKIIYDNSIVGLIINEDGTYSFDASSYDFLSTNEKLDLNTTITIIDTQGATSSADFNISLTGTNDAPSIEVIASSSTSEDTSITIDFTATDIDGTIEEVTASAKYGQVVVNEDRLVYIPNKDYYGEDKITLNVVDNDGVEVTKYISLNIEAINDKPVVSVIEGYEKVVSESTLGEILGAANSYVVISQDDILSSTNITDVDSSSFEITLNQSDYSFTQNGSEYSSSNSLKGVVQVDLLFKMMNPNIDAQIGDFLVYNTSFDSLNVGDEVDVSFYVNIYDGEDYSSKLPINFTVIGTNDTPIIQTINPINATEDGDIETTTITGSDVDVNSSFVFSIDENVDGLTFDENGNASFDPTHPTYQNLNEGELKTVTILVTITDENGGNSTNYLLINILGTNDAPSIESKLVSVQEGSSVINGYLEGVDIDTTAVLTYTTTSNAAGFTLNSNGTYSLDLSVYNYLALNEELDLNIPITVTDDNGASDSSSLNVKIIGTNSTPTIEFITELDVNEDDGVIARGQITSSDVDNGAILTYSTSSLIDGFTLNSNGSYEFDPDFYQHLKDGETLVITVPITVTDENGAQDRDSLSIQVRGENDTPIIDSISSVNVYEDDAIINAQITAVDVDTDSSYSFSSTASLAGFSLNSDGSYSFDPSHSDYQSLNVNDTLVFTIPVTVTDNLGASSTQNLIINLTGTNDYPTLTLDSNGATLEDTTTSINYSTSDIDGTVGMTGSALYGTVTINNDGTIDYQPDANYNGQDTITVTVTDSNGASVTRTSIINVQGTNDAPIIDSVTSNDLVEQSVDTSTVVGVVTASDNDAGTVLQYTLNGGNGYVEVDNTGNVTLTQAGVDAINLDTSNTDLTNFTYTVSVSDGIETVTTETQTIDITRINDVAPVFSASDGSTVTENTLSTSTIVAEFTANDYDDGDSVTYSIISGNDNGYFQIDSNGIVTLTQIGVDAINADMGVDLTKLQIVVSVSDNNNIHTTDSSTIDININRVNDNAPTVVIDTASVNENDSVTVNVLTNDSDLDDSDSLSLTSVSTSANKGTVSIVNQELVFDTGSDFEYLAADETEAVDVTYTVSDGTRTSNSTATITVTGTNDNPDAIDDTATTSEDTAITILASDLLINDTDIDSSDTLSISSVGAATNGNVAIVNGDVVFTPESNFSGTATFEYTISDGNGGSDTATVTLSVSEDGYSLTPTIDLITSSDTGSSSSDDITSDTTPTFEGSTEPNATITIYDELNNQIGQTTADASGNYSITTAMLSDGLQTLKVVASDGLNSDEETTFDITIDTSISLSFTDVQVIREDVLDGGNIDVTAPDSNAGTTQQVVATLSSDADAVYTIDNTKFEIVGNEVKVVSGATFDYETSTSESITITATDSAGNTTNSTFTVNITDYEGSYTTNSSTSINGTSEEDTITGSSEDDTIFGSLGADTIDGGESLVDKDSISYYYASQSVNVNLLTNENHGGDAEGDILTRIERVVGSNYDDNITGDNENNTLVGRNGNDTINGGLGNDFINAGKGADIVDGGEGRDTIAYHESSEAVIVNLSTNENYGGEAEGDDLVNIENVFGSNYDDNISGNSEDNNLWGRDGNDTLYSGLGNDIILGGDGNDTAIFDGNKADYTIFFNSAYARYVITNISTSDVNYVYDDVENIQFDDGTLTSEDLILVAQDDSGFLMQENTTLTITPSEILSNDTDQDISKLTITSVDTPSTGSVILNGQDIEFTPATDFYGTATFTYTVSDGNDEDTVTVSVEVNNTPEASDDTASMIEDDTTTYTIDVLTNDSDVDEDTLLLSVTSPIMISGVEAGTAAIVDNKIEFTPNPIFKDYYGEGQSYSFTIEYSISDNRGGSDNASVNVTFTGTNDTPTLESATANLTETNVILSTSGTLSITDADIGQSEYISQTNTAGTYGSFSIDKNGAWSFTANEAFDSLTNGQVITDTFTVTSKDGTQTSTVTVNITGTNDAPIISTSSTQIASGQIFFDDFTTDLSNWEEVSFNNKDTGNWVIENETLKERSNSAKGLLINKSVYLENITDYSISVDINSKSDVGGNNGAGIAFAYEDVNNYYLVKWIDFGSTYNTNAEYRDLELIKIENGVETVLSVLETEELGVNFNLTVDVSSDNGIVISVDGVEKLTSLETPALYNMGLHTDDNDAGIYYDNVTITIDNKHTISSTNEDDVYEFDVLSQYDQIDDSISIIYVQNPVLLDGVEVGTATINGSNIIFTPNDELDKLSAGEVENILIEYTISDTLGEAINSVISFDVNGVNDAPTAISDTGTVVENSSATIDVLSNDTDVDDNHTFTLDSIDSVTPSKGTVSIVDNKLVFEAIGNDFDYLAVGQSEDIVVTYTMSDENGETSSSSVIVTVTGTNDSPTIDTLVQDSKILSYETFENGVDGWDTTSNESSGELTSFLGRLAGDTIGSEAYSKTYDFGTDYANQTVTISFDIYFIDSFDGEEVKVFIDNSEAGSYSRTGTTTDTNQFWSWGGEKVNSYTLTTTLDASGQFTLGFGSTLDQAISDESFGIDNIKITLANDESTTFTVDTNEDAGIITGSLTASDVDTSDSLTFTTTATISGFTLNSDGTYSLDLSHSDYQSLDEDELLTLTIPISVTDGNSGTDSQNLVINITGTNDFPVIDTITTVNVSEDDSIINGTITSSDIDDSSTVTYSSYTITYDVANATTVSGFTLNSDGTYTFDASHQDYQGLAAGEVQTITIPIIATDDKGFTDTQNLVINLTGTNDTPVAVADSLYFEAQNATLIGELDFDDGVPTAILGTVTSDTTDGVISNSADFDSGKVSLENLDLDNTTGAKTTITMWIQGNSTGDWEMLVGSRYYDLVLKNGNIGFNSATGDLYGTDASILNDNAWHQVVAVFTNGDYTKNSLYIDGKEVSLSSLHNNSINTYNTNIDSENGTLYFGGWGNDQFTFTGSMDEVKVYNGELNSSEVASLYYLESNSDKWNIVTTNENEAVTINADNLILNDTDTDGDTLSVTSVTNPTNGTVTLDTDTNEIIFTPDTDFYGTATFEYTISDGNGGESTATANVEVNNVPEATADIVDGLVTVRSLGYDDTGYGSLAVGVFVNDSQIVTATRGTTITVLDDSNNLLQSSTFDTYYSSSDESTALINYLDNIKTTYVNTDVKIIVSTKDEWTNSLTTEARTALESIGADATILSSVQFRTSYVLVSNYVDGSFSVEFEEYSGQNTDGILYSYETNDGLGEDVVLENSCITLDVLSNDTDIDGDDLILSVESPISFNYLGTDYEVGTATVVDNKILFTPNSTLDILPTGANIDLNINYTISDGRGGSDTSTATLKITGTNDEPISVDDSDTVEENLSITVDLLANDTDIDFGHTFTLDYVNSSKGNVSIVDNKLVFEAVGSDFDYLDDGESEVVTVNYTMSDENGASSSSSATITVTGTNDAPTVVADTYNEMVFNSTESDYIDVSDIAANSGLYDADGNYLGFTFTSVVTYDSFQFWSRILDFGVGESSDNIIISNYGTTNDLMIEIYNGADKTNGSLQLENFFELGVKTTLTVTQDTTGTLSIYKDGVLVYEVANFNIPNNVTRTSNYIGDSNWGADGFLDATLDEFGLFSGVLSSDDITTLYESGVSSFTSNSDALILLDSNSLDNQAENSTITITNNGVTVETQTVDEDETIIIDVLSNDSDAEGETLTLVSATNPQLNGVDAGTVTIVDNKVVFTPNDELDTLSDGDTETLTFEYVVSDGSDTTTGSVSFDVTGSTDYSIPIDGRVIDESNYLINSDALLAGATSVDVSMTIKSSKSGVTSALLSYNADGEDNEFLIFTTSSGHIQLYVNGSSKVLNSVNVLDGNEHDINLVWNSTSDTNGNNVYLIIDGITYEYSHNPDTNTSISDDASGTLVLGQEQDSPGGGFVDGQAYSGTYSDVKIAVDGVQVANWSMNNSTFSNGDIIEDTSGNNHNLTVNLNTSSIQGTVSDGYILGATVFADANENGVLDEGESYDTTDIYGNYELSDAVGTLTLVGGVDISTNLMFNTVMTAPDGSTMITPYTTIIDKMIKLDDTISIEDANSILLEALGLDEGIDLLTLDALEEYESNTDLGLATQKIAVLILSMNAFIETFNDENGFELLALDAMTGSDFNFTNEAWISSLVETSDDRVIETISSINEAMLNSNTLEELVQIQIEASTILTDIQNGNIENYNTLDIEDMSDDNEVGLLTKEEISDLTDSIEVSIVSYKVAGNEVEFIAGETVSLSEGEFTLYDNGEYTFVPNDETYVGVLSEVTYMTNIGVQESFTPSYLENIFDENTEINNIEMYHTNIISLEIDELISDSESLEYLFNYIDENNNKSVEDTQITNNSENYQLVEAEIIENSASLSRDIENLMQIDIDMF